MRRITIAEWERRISDPTLGYVGAFGGSVGNQAQEIVLDTQDGMLLFTRWELETRGADFGVFIRLPKDLDDLLGTCYLDHQ